MLEIGQEWLLYVTPFRMKETTAPSGGQIIPDAISLYAKDRSSISSLYWMNDAGTEFDLAAMVTGTGVANRVAIWTSTTAIGSDADLTFVTDTLTATKLVVPTLATFTLAATFSFLTAGRIPYASTAGALADSANLQWDNSNVRLGVGGTPGSPLHVKQESTSFTVVLESYNNTFSNSINFKTARGTAAAATQVTADAGIGRIAFSGYTSAAAFANQTAIIQALAAEGFTGSAQGTYIDLMTTPIASTTVATRFRIGPSGQWGIGGATYGTANNIYKSGGASAAPSWGTVNILDSDSHGDTLTGTVVRGDLIVGNSTPKWGRFAKGASGTILQMGANDPAWVALSTISHASWGSQLADDHTQYALLAGRSGGQTLAGGTAAGDDIGLYGTTNATPTVGTNGSGAVVNIGVNSGATHPVATAFLETADAAIFRMKSPGSSKQVNLEWADANTRKWALYKLTTDELALYDSVNSQTIFTYSPASAGVQFLIRCHPTWAPTTANSVAFLIDPVFTGSANGAQGFNSTPEFNPSANMAASYANLSINTSNPPSTITITQAIGAYYRNDYKSSVGAITTGINCITAGVNITGSVKPTNQFGMYCGNQGAAGIGLAANLYIDPCSGATSSFDIGFGGSDGTAVGAYFGRIPILYAGLLKYLAVYS